MWEFNWGVFWAIFAALLLWHLVSRLHRVTVVIAEADLATIHERLESFDERLESIEDTLRQIGDSVSPIAIKLATRK